MLLEDNTAVIYGAGGSIGGAVARAFAREGAHIHLAGWTPEPLERVAADIRATGGAASTAALDLSTSAPSTRHMLSRRSGVLLMFGGHGDPLPGHHLGGLQVAFGALESLRRNLASELGPHECA